MILILLSVTLAARVAVAAEQAPYGHLSDAAAAATADATCNPADAGRQGVSIENVCDSKLAAAALAVDLSDSESARDSWGKTVGRPLSGCFAIAFAETLSRVDPATQKVVTTCTGGGSSTKSKVIAS